MIPVRGSPAEIRAGWVVAAVLLAAAIGDARGDGAERLTLSPCARPLEVSAADGHTRRVRCAPAGGGVGGAEIRGPARALFGLGIDPNRATASTLEALPGVGPARAAAIVAGRAEAPYREVGDLLRVRGIGPVTLRRVAGWLTIPAAERRPDETGSLPVIPREPPP